MFQLDTSVDVEKETFYEELLKAKVLELCAPYRCTVYLFGSRSEGTYRRTSDFDIGIMGLSDIDFFHLKMKLEEWIEESPIPHSLDVVNFSKVSPEFLEQALQGAKVWKSD